MLAQLKARARNAALKAFFECFGDQELQVLSGLGIDGKTIVFDSLIQECENLKKEMTHE